MPPPAVKSKGHWTQGSTHFDEKRNAQSLVALGVSAGGGRGARTPDPMRVGHVLYQLSYASLTGFLCSIILSFSPIVNSKNERDEVKPHRKVRLVFFC